MVKVKVCGITNLEDALSAVRAGADALGFVFYKHSPRYIGPEKARAIIKALPKSIKKVGVFVNAREATVRRLARYLQLDMLQFHGNESEEFCSRFQGFKIIKAFRVGESLQARELLKYDVWAYLFDACVRNKFGGTGRSFNWQLLSSLEGLPKTVFLSGGLKPGNVRFALKAFCAQWVDASSSLERYPGKKEPKKMESFIRKVKLC